MVRKKGKGQAQNAEAKPAENGVAAEKPESPPASPPRKPVESPVHSPAPDPAPQDDGAADNAAKNKNKKKKKKAIQSDDGPLMPKVEATEAETKRNDLLQSLTDEFRRYPDMSKWQKPDKDLKKKLGEQNTRLREMLNQLDASAAEFRVRNPKTKTPLPQLNSQLREIDASGDKSEEAREMKNMLREKIIECVRFENYKKWQGELQKLKQDIETRGQNNAGKLNEARAAEENEELKHRVAAAKNLTTEELANAKVNTATVDPPPAVLEPMFGHPYFLSRKLEKIFGVVIERERREQGRSKTMKITGLDDEPFKCVTHINQLDFSAKMDLECDSRVARAIVGPGGSKVREWETENGAYLCNNKEMTKFTVFGNKDQVTAAKAHVKEMTEEVGHFIEVRVSPAEVRVLGMDSRAEVRKAEKDTSCNIQVQQNDCMVVIRGNKVNAEKAKKQIQAWLKTQHAEMVSVDYAAVGKLYRARRDADDDSYQGKVAQKFGELRDGSGVTMLRGDDSITLVGDKAKVVKAKKTLEELVGQCGHSGGFIEITQAQRGVFSDTNITLIETTCNIDCQFMRRDNNLRLAIYGSEENKAAAEKFIADLVEREGYSEEIPCSEHSCRALKARQGEKIRDIEDSTGCRVSVGREGDAKVTLFGNKECVKAAVSMLTDFIADTDAYAASLVDKVIELPNASLISRIIGTKGATIREIRTSSGVDRLDVSDDPPQVTLKGTIDAVASAEDMLVDIIGDAQSVEVDFDAEPKPKPTKQEPPKKEAPPDLASDELFPSLGGVSKPPPKKKFGSGRWGKKADANEEE